TPPGNGSRSAGEQAPPRLPPVPPPPVSPRTAVPPGPPPAVHLPQSSNPGTSASQLLDFQAVAQLRSLQRLAAERYAAMDSYIVRLRRREQVNGKDKPEEIILLKFRKDPWSVYFKWLGTEGRGREVVYVKGRYEDKIHTLLAAGDVPLMPAGKRIALARDNPLVRASSRHPITEAGFGSLLERLDAAVTLAERGEAGAATIRCLGVLKRPEFELPGQAFERTILPGNEAALPHGGRRFYFFDPLTTLPPL